MSMTLSAAAASVGNSNDLVDEILSRLPLNCVKRFRLVCKEWHSLATTRFFIDMHQNNINHSPPCYVVQYFNYSSSTEYSLDCTTKKSDHFNTLFLNFDEDDNDDNNMKFKSVRESINLSSNFSLKGGGGEEKKLGKIYYQQQRTNLFHKKRYYHIKLISSYRGFLLYTAKPAAADMSMSARFRRWLTKDVEEEEEDQALILYNPVTKEKHNVTAPLSTHVYCGFYYHSPTKEHRILYQLKFDPHHHEYEAGVVKFLVFGMETKSTRVLKLQVINNITCYHYHLDTSTPPVISNGSLHWVVSEGDPRNLENPICSRSILSFGIESEEFHMMPHPPFSHTCIARGCIEVGLYRHKMNFLEMEGGVLCLCDGYGGEYRFTKPILEIYVMEDYKKWTWIWRYRINLENHIDDTYKYGSKYKALQVLQGDWLLLHLFHTKYQQYLLYSLNGHKDGEDFPSKPSTRTVIRKGNIITNKRQTNFQVRIDGFDRLLRGNRIYGRLLTRMIIKFDRKKRPPSVGGNMVVLTPSLASFHHNRSAPPRISTFFSIRTNRSYEYID